MRDGDTGAETSFRVSEWRPLAGLCMEDAASASGRSPATVKRDWTMARVWLYREVRSHPSHPEERAR